MKPFRYLIAVAAALVLCGPGAQAQTARTIKVVVPFPAGGSADDLARLLADQIARAQGASFVIEHRPGAGTVVGTEAVSGAAPDGPRVDRRELIHHQPSSKLNYDPFSGFAPICNLVSSPLVVA
jgi:tripartite-type tricarboxylate transporter receptor subunit TctC